MIPRQETIEKIMELGSHLLGIDACQYSNPLLESEILLAYALRKNKEYLIAHAKDAINQKYIQRYLQLIKLRKKKWPISQIIKHKEFYSRNFFVNNQVLIPRPETEHLIDATLKELEHFQLIKAPIQILDIGTGSGCIAITLALEENSKDLYLTAIDSSSKALSVAKKNWANYKHLTNNTLRFRLADIHNFNSRKQFDFIVSNPPYIPTKDTHLVADDVLKREPRKALFARDNGLEFYVVIKNFCDTNLKNNSGIVVLEVYPPTHQEVIKIFSNYKCTIIKDYFGKNRILVFKKTLS